MRTTLDLDDRLLRAARKHAVDQGKTLTAVVEEALTLLVLPRPRVAEAFRLRWKTHRGTLQPGVDLADRDVLYDKMDERE